MKNSTSLLLLLSAFIFCAGCHGKTVFVNDEGVVQQGENLNLNCQSMDDYNTEEYGQYFWGVRSRSDDQNEYVPFYYRNGPAIEFLDQDLIDDSRLTFYNNGRTMEMTNLDLSDNGLEFKCVYTRDSEVYETYSAVEVYTYATNPAVLKGKDVFTEGPTSIGGCLSGFGYPKPEVKFFMDGMEVENMEETEELKIQNSDGFQVSVLRLLKMNISLEDHGKQITCQINSGIYPFNTTQSEVVTQISIEHEMTKVEVTPHIPVRNGFNVGQLISFKCSYDGYPQGTILSFGMPGHNTYKSKTRVRITEDMDGQQVSCTVQPANPDQYPVTAYYTIRVNRLRDIEIEGGHVIESTPLLLDCHVDAWPPAEIMWTRGLDYKLKSGAQLMVEEPGTYYCWASNDAGKLQSEEHKVYDSEWVDMNMENAYASNGADSVTMVCDVNFSPGLAGDDYEKRWYKVDERTGENQLVMVYDSSSDRSRVFFSDWKYSADNHANLEIKSVYLSDSNMYKCEVEVGYISRSVTAELEVQGFFAMWYEPEEQVEVTVGSTLDLECMVVSNPQSTIFWNREDGPRGPRNIEEGEDIEISEVFNPNHHTMTSYLKIHNFPAISSAVYKCSAYFEPRGSFEEKKFLISTNPMDYSEEMHEEFPTSTTTEMTSTTSQPEEEYETPVTTEPESFEENKGDYDYNVNKSEEDYEEEPSVRMMVPHPTESDEDSAVTSDVSPTEYNTMSYSTSQDNAYQTETTEESFQSTTEEDQETTVGMSVETTKTPEQETTEQSTQSATSESYSQETTEEMMSFETTTEDDQTTESMTTEQYMQETTEQEMTTTEEMSESTTQKEMSTSAQEEYTTQVAEEDTTEESSQETTSTMTSTTYSEEAEEEETTEESYFSTQASQEATTEKYSEEMTETESTTESTPQETTESAEQESEETTMAQQYYFPSCQLPNKGRPSNMTHYDGDVNMPKFSFNVVKKKEELSREESFYTNGEMQQIVIKSVSRPKGKGKKLLRGSIKISQVDVYVFNLRHQHCMSDDFNNMSYEEKMDIDNCSPIYLKSGKGKRRVKAKIPINSEYPECPLVLWLKIYAEDGAVYFEKIENDHFFDASNLNRSITLVMKAGN